MAGGRSVSELVGLDRHDDSLLAFAKAHGITLQAWGALGAGVWGPSILKHPALVAAAAAHNVTTAQAHHALIGLRLSLSHALGSPRLGAHPTPRNANACEMLGLRSRCDGPSSKASSSSPALQTRLTWRRTSTCGTSSSARQR